MPVKGKGNLEQPRTKQVKDQQLCPDIMHFEGIILLFLLFFAVKCTNEGIRLEYDVCQHNELIFCVNPHEERLAWTFVNDEKEIWLVIQFNFIYLA